MKRILEAPSRRVANIFNEVDLNFIDVCNSLFKIGYPNYTLVNYAEPLNEPSAPTTNDCYLVKEDGTVWDLTVEENDIILYNGADWEILDYKITEIKAALQSFVQKSAAYTLTPADVVVECTANTFTITLPTAVDISGKKYTIKNSGAGVITVDADDTETIDGATTKTLNQYDSITIVSNNSNWIII